MNLLELKELKVGDKFLHHKKVATVITNQYWEEQVGTFADEKGLKRQMIGKNLVLHFKTDQDVVLVSQHPSLKSVELDHYLSLE